jgi:hypothetical protein
MNRDRVFHHTADQCRQLALRVRTDAARRSLLKVAEDFEAKAEREYDRDIERRLEAAD